MFDSKFENIGKLNSVRICPRKKRKTLCNIGPPEPHLSSVIKVQIVTANRTLDTEPGHSVHAHHVDADSGRSLGDDARFYPPQHVKWNGTCQRQLQHKNAGVRGCRLGGTWVY